MAVNKEQCHQLHLCVVLVDNMIDAIDRASDTQEAAVDIARYKREAIAMCALAQQSAKPFKGMTASAIQEAILSDAKCRALLAFYEDDDFPDAPERNKRTALMYAKEIVELAADDRPAHRIVGDRLEGVKVND